MKHIDRQIEALTIRLTTCNLDEFHAVQAELFALKNKRESMNKESTESAAQRLLHDVEASMRRTI